MSIKVVQTVLAAAVATNGTFAVTYPTGFTKGDFALGYTHKFSAIGAIFKAPKDFTTSFGNTSVTVTYLGATTIPANTIVQFQFDMAGRDNQYANNESRVSSKNVFREGRAVEVNFGSPATASTTNLVSAATGTQLPNATTTTYTYAATGGTAPLNGAITNGVLDVARNVVATVTHASSIVATTIVVKGLRFGVALSETLTITATGTSKTATGNKTFDSLTSVAITSASDSTANTVNLGTGNKLGLPVPVTDANQILQELISGARMGAFADRVVIPYSINQTDLLAPTAQEIVAPCAGTIIAHRSVVQVAITTGGTLQPKINNTNTTGGVATVANAATKGTVNTGTAFTAANTVAAGDRISILPASFATAGAVNGEIEISPTRSSGLRGTLVVADTTTTGAATSGDIFGTYTPETVPDGSTSYQLWILSTETTSAGTPQFSA